VSKSSPELLEGWRRARTVASVSAEALRPTGPAATDASAPSFTLLMRIPLAPRSFITRSTTCVASPIWRPNLETKASARKRHHGGNSPGSPKVFPTAAGHRAATVASANMERGSADHFRSMGADLARANSRLS
jgi:hypothetical protein